MPPSTSLFSLSHPATTITHSLSCPLISPNSNALVIASPHELRVYELSDDVLESQRNADQDEEDLMEPSHLIHVASIKLHGTISSIASLRIAPSPRHSLAISYLEDAKISVVEWDDARNQFRTVSLHYLEDDVLKDGKCQMHQRVEAPLRSDPKSRCLAYMLFDTKLVILPVREESELEDLAASTNVKATNSLLQARNAASNAVAGLPSTTITTSTVAQNSDDASVPPPVGRHIIIDVAQRLGIRNVHDYCFLYGYSEPTLLILHENIQTWSAQLTRRANTVSCTAVSLGIERNQYPIIWTVKALPHDSYRLVPLRQPVGGGALVVGHNSLIHVNQRAQYGLSTNDFALMEICHPEQMAVHLEVQEDITLFLEVVSFAFIATNVLALSLRSGELYLAHIFGNANTIQKIILKKAKSTVVAATMCTHNGTYLFLGSRLGNSILTQFKEKNKRKERPNGSKSEEPDRKRRRKEESSIAFSSDDAFLKMLEVDTEDVIANNSFAEDTSGAHRVREFVFHAKDTFINIGPITNMAVGNVHTRGSDMDLKSKTDPRIELSTCSGHAKTGTICVLQRNLRPKYLANMKVIPQISASHVCDAIYYIDHNDEAIGKIVIATMGPRSIIMSPSSNDTAKTGAKQSDSVHDNVFARVDKTRLQVNDPTLAAGALTVDRSISVQVCPTKITLLKDAKIMYTKPFDIPVHSAHVLAPYVLLHFEDGTLKLFSCVGNQRKLTTKTVSLSMATKAATLDAADMPPEAITATSLFRNRCRNRALFSEKDVKTGEWVHSEYLAFVCWSNGAMEIYTVPDFKCVFSFMQFNDLYGIMFDQNPSAEERDDFARKNKLASLYVQEILMYSLSSELENPYLFVRMSNNSVHIYQTFSFNAQRAASSSVISADILQQENQGRLSHLRFSKIEHEFMDDILSKRNRSILRLDLLNKERHYSIFDKRYDTGLKHFVPFTNIGGVYRGVFVTGKTPLWVMGDIHNEIRIHPMTIDGSVTAFTPTTGGRFIYATSNQTNLKVHAEIRQPISAEAVGVGTSRKAYIGPDAGSFLRVASLRSDVLYDTHWPTKIVPLKRTPHQIVFEQETSTYSVSVSKPISFENVEETLEGRFPKPQSLKFEVLLYSHKFQKMDIIEFDDFEQVLSMKVVSLMDRGEDPYNPIRGREKGLVTLLAIGTGIDGSEDDRCKGRVLLYDFKGSIQGDEYFKFEKLGELELKEGPVTAIDTVDGYLSLSIGTKVNTYYFNWEDKEIVQTSFFDSQYFTTSMKSIKNYILYGDMYESLNLLWWNEQGHQLTLLGKDPHRLLTYAVEFLYSDAELGLMVTDEGRNVQVFRFAPEEASTHDGKWLLPVADVHVGSHINTTVRLPARKSHPSDRLSVDLDTGMVVFATLEGEIGSITPLDSNSFRPLSLLQSKLFTQIAHACGLHPKAYRLFQPNSFNPIHVHQKNILDGELLKQYMHCDHKLQVLIAKQLGYRPVDFTKA
eukprot:CAMPEP_0117450502 /NCGR_PEP_ID=MMETSP0759-20121206/8501_1 /TAXON_ID=63605 /ORGANISM="Percolomonas cosmopolitus, Strain WS" /LENGTH=1476 /DNA_ID=CAMNT_0005243025 /DNA_START=193 /DNA_END=4620 /DNA_ORIENTATION=+